MLKASFFDEVPATCGTKTKRDRHRVRKDALILFSISDGQSNVDGIWL